jgi:hypothetical protein
MFYSTVSFQLSLNESQQEVLNKIVKGVISPETIHVLDARRVACIFRDSFNRGKISSDDIGEIIENLPSEFRGGTHERIHQIAEVVEMLSHCHEF